MPATQRVRVRVKGRVQGVFFRSTVEEKADELGLTGWVRNTADGDVEAEFQGEPEAVDRAVAFCRQGPPHAQVTDVDVDELSPSKGSDGFRVL